MSASARRFFFAPREKVMRDELRMFAVERSSRILLAMIEGVIRGRTNLPAANHWQYIELTRDPVSGPL